MPSIPRSYRLDAIEQLLGHDRGALSRAGLLAAITSYGYGLYDAGEVEAWAERLARRRALIRLGALHRTAPLLEAPAFDEYDFPCPACGGLAMWKPPQNEEDWSAWAMLHEDDSIEYPAACSRCNCRLAGKGESDA